MGRQLRPALPGTVFHITARTQWQEPLFRGSEEQIAALIRSSVDRSDARLFAYAVMANHIHVVVMQGRRALAGYMQPLLRRIALLVNRTRPRQGHVFCGRFHHSVCLDPEYFRSIIAYVHLNPVRAGICRRPEQYRWTSHRDYLGGDASLLPPLHGLAIEDALRVFANGSDQLLPKCRRDYVGYVSWRQDMDRYLGAEQDSWVALPRPRSALGGDAFWYRNFSTPLSLRITRAITPPPRAEDLRDYMRASLQEVAPDLPLDLLRCGGHARALVQVRRQVIARALAAGYTGQKVAAFLNVSPSAVSLVRARLRGVDVSVRQ